MADLMALAAERYADRVAARYKADGAWHDVTSPRPAGRSTRSRSA